MSVPAVLRATTGALIPESVVGEIFKEAAKTSAVMSSFRQLTVPETTTKLNLLASMPHAAWRNGDTGRSSISKLEWASKQLVVDDLDVIVPIPKTVLDDSKYDLWAEVRPLIAEAIAMKLDSTVLFGEGKIPSSFPAAIFPAATAASRVWDLGDSTQAEGGLAEDINQTFKKVTECGYRATALIAENAFQHSLMSARDTTGQRLADISSDSLWGIPIRYTLGGEFGAATDRPVAFAVDGRKFVLGLRKDLSFEIANEASLYDDDGNLLYNLWQQGMVALRVCLRAGWQFTAPVTQESARLGTNEKQTLTITGSPTDGTWTASFGGTDWTTKPIPIAATGADVRDRLAALGTIGRDNVKVVRTGTTPNWIYTVEFCNALGSRNVDQLVVANTFTGGSSPTMTAATTVAGVAGTPYPAAILVNP